MNNEAAVRFAGVLAPNHHEHGLIVVTLELLVHVADFEHGDVEAAKTLAERFEPNKGVSYSELVWPINIILRSLSESAFSCLI